MTVDVNDLDLALRESVVMLRYHHRRKDLADLLDDHRIGWISDMRDQRNDAIRQARWRDGRTLGDIAKEHHLTRARVQEISREKPQYLCEGCGRRGRVVWQSTYYECPVCRWLGPLNNGRLDG